MLWFSGVVVVFGCRYDFRVSLWFRGIAVVSGCRRGVKVSLHPGGYIGQRGEMGGESEPRQMSWLEFHDTLYGPPTPWVPPRVCPSPIPPSNKYEPTHIPFKRGGVDLAVRLLGRWWWSPHPSTEGRGGADGQVVRGLGRVVVAKAKVVILEEDEQTSTVMGLMFV